MAKIRIEQDTILDLSKVVKDNLKKGVYKKSKKQVDFLINQKKSIIKGNRVRGQIRRSLKKELYSKGTTKIRAKQIFKELGEYQKVDISSINNEIKMKSGEPFFFTINTGGFGLDLWGKERTSFRIKSTTIEKAPPGKVEKMIMKRFEKSLQNSIKKEDHPKVLIGLAKLIDKVKYNISVISTGIEEYEDYEAEFIGESPVPILIDFVAENIDINV